MKARDRASGFTLIELLVALVIFGIFAVLAYAGLARLLDNRERLTAEQRVWQQLSQAFLRISDDLEHARARPVRDAAGVQLLPAFVGRPFDSRALAEPSLELTRGGELNYGEGVHSDLRRVLEQREARPVQRAAAQPVGRAAVGHVLHLPEPDLMRKGDLDRDRRRDRHDHHRGHQGDSALRAPGAHHWFTRNRRLKRPRPFTASVTSIARGGTLGPPLVAVGQVSAGTPVWS